MKQCPACKSVFPPDIDFCLIDGSTLIAASAPAPPPPIYQRDTPTQVLYQQTPATAATPTWLYLALGGLGAVVIAAVLFVVWFAGRAPANNNFTNAGKPPEEPKTTTAVVVNTPAATTYQPPVNTPAQPVPNVSPAGRWTGDWTSPSGAYLTIAVNLSDDGSGGVDGSIEWTLRQTRRPEKMSKIGMSATEFVSGRFDPATRALTLKGTRKDDPNGVLVMVDNYRLTLSGDARSLTGQARNGGKWNATVNLSR